MKKINAIFMEPVVSVIIATKNEEKNIAKCLQSVRAQDFDSGLVETIVVDNGEDETKKIAQSYTPFVWGFDAGERRSAQRNFGLKKAKGKYFLFLDADMEIGVGLISECVRQMEKDSSLVGLYVPEIINGGGYWCRVREFERGFYNGTIIDGLRFIRTNLARSVGGFDENLYAAEDWDLDKKLKKFGRTAITRSVLYHNESGFKLKKYLGKKAYYSGNFHLYRNKWGTEDPDVKKQFGIYYRYFGVFVENGKWKRLISRPMLAIGMYFLKFMIGLNYLRKADG